MTGHEKIMQLRKELDIPERDEPDYDARDRAEMRARAARIEQAATQEEYVKLFNRSYWDDRWLGAPEDDPGLLSTVPFVEAKPMNKKERKQEVEKARREWRAKYVPKLKTIHLDAEEKESKTVRKLRRKRRRAEEQREWQKKIDVAYWFLERWCTPFYAWEVTREHGSSTEELVNWCYDFVSSWAEEMTGNRVLSVEEGYERLQARMRDARDIVEDIDGMKFRRLEVAEKRRRSYVCDPMEDPFPDIPDEYWEEFLAWSKEHKLKKFKKEAERYAYYGKYLVSPEGLQRCAFLKFINKRNKTWRNNLMLHDPMTGASFVSEKQMKKHIHRQLRSYDKRRKQFVEMLDDLVARGQLSQDYADHMMGDTKLTRDRIRERWKQDYERLKLHQKEEKKRYKKQKESYNARKKWFEKYGGNIAQAPFTITTEGGDRISVELMGNDPKHPIYKIDDQALGSTSYSEGSLATALDIGAEPEPPRKLEKPHFGKDYWEEYARLPNY